MKSIIHKLPTTCLLLLCLGLLTSCTPQIGENSLPPEESTPAEESGSNIDPEKTEIPLTDPSMPSDDAYHPETDCQYTWWGRNIEGLPFYRTSAGLAYWGLGRLYFIDETTVEPQLSCFRPDCSHSWYDNACTADMIDCIDGISYADGKLYYSNDYLNPTTGKHEVGFYSMDLTGANRKLVRDFPEGGASVNWLLHRGYLYSYFQEYSSDGESSTLKLTQTSLAHPEQPRILFQKSAIGPFIGIGYLNAVGNYLIFVDNSNDPFFEVYSMNLQTGEVKTCSSWEGSSITDVCTAGNRLIIQTQDTDQIRFYSLSLDLTDPISYPEWDAPASDPVVLYVSGDSQYLYKHGYDLDSRTHGILEITDHQGNIVDTVDLSVFDGRNFPLRLDCDPKEDGLIFLSPNISRSGFYYFKKSEIGSGHIELLPLTEVCNQNEYTPPGQTGINDSVD